MTSMALSVYVRVRGIVKRTILGCDFARRCAKLILNKFYRYINVSMYACKCRLLLMNVGIS